MVLVTLIASCVVLYLIGLAVYRLYFSPLAHAKVPGPKLAALSRWYEAYYDIYLKGRMEMHLDELHARYGTTSSLFTHSRTYEAFRTINSNHARRGSHQRFLVLRRTFRPPQDQ